MKYYPAIKRNAMLIIWMNLKNIIPNSSKQTQMSLIGGGETRQGLHMDRRSLWER
jgi:hypothetical protein